MKSISHAEFLNSLFNITMGVQISHQHKAAVAASWAALRKQLPLLDAKLTDKIQYNENYTQNEPVDLTEMAFKHSAMFPEKSLVAAVTECANDFAAELKGCASDA